MEVSQSLRLHATTTSTNTPPTRHPRQGLVRATLPVTPEVENAYGTLHGGAISTIVDVVGTMAIMSKDPTKPGVSVELGTSYTSAAKSGTTVTIEGKLLKLGGKLAFTQVDIFREDGQVVATGRHTKVRSRSGTSTAWAFLTHPHPAPRQYDRAGDLAVPITEASFEAEPQYAHVICSVI